MTVNYTPLYIQKEFLKINNIVQEYNHESITFESPRTWWNPFSNCLLDVLDSNQPCQLLIFHQIAWQKPFVNFFPKKAFKQRREAHRQQKGNQHDKIKSFIKKEINFLDYWTQLNSVKTRCVEMRNNILLEKENKPTNIWVTYIHLFQLFKMSF